MKENVNEQSAERPKINKKTIVSAIKWVASIVTALLVFREGYYATYEDFVVKPREERIAAEKAKEDAYKAEVTKRKDFVLMYGQSAQAHVVNDGIVHKDGEITIKYDKIMKLPPNGGYWFHAYIGDESGNVIANSGGNRNPDGVWGPRFYAADWDDHSFVSFQGSGFRVPERLKPGNYTVVCILEVSTEYGNFTGWLHPIPFTLVENE